MKDMAESKQCVREKWRNKTTEEVIQIHNGHIEVRVHVRAIVPNVPKSRKSAHYLTAQNHPHVKKCRPVDSGHVYNDVDTQQFIW